LLPLYGTDWFLFLTYTEVNTHGINAKTYWPVS
jgi:hypothetical protein